MSRKVDLYELASAWARAAAEAARADSVADYLTCLEAVDHAHTAFLRKLQLSLDDHKELSRRFKDGKNAATAGAA